MASDQISLEEYLAVNQKTTQYQAPVSSGLGSISVTPIPSLYSGSGTLHPTYGAVPNVTIGTSAVGVNVGPAGMWTTTGTGTSYSLNHKTVSGGKVHIMGEDADLVIGDKSMRTWMEKVEERLNILTPNPEMEKEWDDLRKLGERYRKLEKKCKEKSEVWKRLKAT